LLAIKFVGQEVSQRQFGKVDTEEEHNWHADSVEVEGFKGGRMYNSRERVLQFAAEVIPIQWGMGPYIIAIDGETLQTTEWESENSNERFAIQGLQVIKFDGNTSDKGLNDRIFNKDLMKPLGGLITTEIKIREEVFATGKKE
jgi:hypothetical protein